MNMNTSVSYDREQIEKHLRILKTGFCEGEDLLEIRKLGDNRKPEFRFFSTIKEAVDHIAEVAGKTNVYVIVNPIRKDAIIEKATKDEHIDKRRWLIFDFDVQKEAKGGVDKQSRPEQKAYTLALARNFILDLKKYGFDDPLVTDSGNGTKVLYRTNLDNTPENNKLVSRLYDILAELYTDDIVSFDTTVQNPARVERVCGAPNIKGKGKDGYEVRIPRIIEEPQNITIVTIDMIKSIIDAYTPVMSEPETGGAVKNLEIVKRVLSEGSINIKRIEENCGNHAYKIIIDRCPNEKEHSTPDTDTTVAVFINRDGAIGYKCQHSHCINLGWKDIRKMIEPEYEPMRVETPKSDALFADQFADEYYLSVIYCPDNKQWYSWNNNGFWEPSPDEVIRGKMLDFLKKKYTEEKKKAEDEVDNTPKETKNKKGDLITETEDEVQARIQKFVKARIGYMTKLFDTNLGNPLSFAKSNPKLMVGLHQINNTNGMLNVRGGLYDTNCQVFMKDCVENRKLYLTFQCAATYDPKADCPKFKAMMTRIFPDEETRNFARRMIGYILTGDHNLQVHFLWYGVGGTGKSTLMDILVRFLDSYAAIASEDAFLLNKFGNSNRFALANLIMKILVGIQEAPAGREYNYSLIKAWDAKDKMSIDEKGKPIYNAYPHGPLVILTNHEPYIDPSEVNSVSRRHIILPFEAIVARDNPRIVTEIIQEESSGLLNYFIECISMYRKDGLNVPKTINDLTKNWAEFHQPVKSFIVDNMKFSVGKSTKASDVFDEYEEYSSSIDEDAVSRKKFYTILKSEGYKLNQGRDKALYLLDYEWNYASDWMQKRANEKSKFDPAIGICRIR